MPTPTLREAHREATKERIVRAVADLLAEQNPAAISVEMIADRSGTSIATLYRHFKNKEALLDAVATVGYSPRRGRRDAPEPLPLFLARRWGEIISNAGLFRAQHSTAAGREVRKRRLRVHRDATRHALRREGVDVTSPSGRRLLDLTLLLSSSAAALELHEHLGLDVDEAAAHAVWAIAELTGATLREQQAPAPPATIKDGR
jgi:AcrR family transcriptional regulator